MHNNLIYHNKAFINNDKITNIDFLKNYIYKQFYKLISELIIYGF